MRLVRRALIVDALIGVIGFTVIGIGFFFQDQKKVLPLEDTIETERIYRFAHIGGELKVIGTNLLILSVCMLLILCFSYILIKRKNESK